MNIVTREGHNHLVSVGWQELKLWKKKIFIFCSYVCIIFNIFLRFHRLRNESECESTLAMNHGNMVDFHSKYKSSIVESSILRELDLVCSGHEEVHKGFVIRRKSEEWAMLFKNDVLMRCSIDTQIKVNHRIVSINVFIHVIVPAGNPLIWNVLHILRCLWRKRLRSRIIGWAASERMPNLCHRSVKVL